MISVVVAYVVVPLDESESVFFFLQYKINIYHKFWSFGSEKAETVVQHDTNKIVLIYFGYGKSFLKIRQSLQSKAAQI